MGTTTDYKIHILGVYQEVLEESLYVVNNTRNPCWGIGDSSLFVHVVSISPLSSILCAFISLAFGWTRFSSLCAFACLSPLCASCASHLNELTLILGATHSFWLQLTNLICSCSFPALLCSPPDLLLMLQNTSFNLEADFIQCRFSTCSLCQLDFFSPLPPSSPSQWQLSH